MTTRFSPRLHAVSDKGGGRPTSSTLVTSEGDTSQDKTLDTTSESNVTGNKTLDVTQSDTDVDDVHKDFTHSDDDIPSEIEEELGRLSSPEISAEDKTISEHLAELDPGHVTPTTPDVPKIAARSSRGNVWTSEKIQDLCSMWESEVHLYDPVHEDYSNRIKRATTIQRMAAKLNVTGNFPPYHTHTMPKRKS